MHKLLTRITSLFRRVVWLFTPTEKFWVIGWVIAWAVGTPWWWTGVVSCTVFWVLWYLFDAWRQSQSISSGVFLAWCYVRSSPLAMLLTLALLYGFTGGNLRWWLAIVGFSEPMVLSYISAKPFLRWEVSALFVSFTYVIILWIVLLSKKSTWLNDADHRVPILLGAGVVLAIAVTGFTAVYYLGYIEDLVGYVEGADQKNPEVYVNSYAKYVVSLLFALLVVILIDWLLVLGSKKTRVHRAYSAFLYYGDFPLFVGLTVVAATFFLFKGELLAGSEAVSFFGGAIAIHLVGTNVTYMIIEMRERLDLF